MFKQLFKDLSEGGLLAMPLLTMLFFLVVFCGVLWIALSRTRRDHYDAMARLPLDEDAGETDVFVTEAK